MTHQEKEIALKQMLQELKEGKPEAEVKKEFASLFPKENQSVQPNNWEMSSSVPVPELKPGVNASYQNEHPLVVFASESAALRALMKNIRIDLNDEHGDEVSVSMLKSELARLRQIQVHYRKKEELLFPFLAKEGVTTLPEVKKKDEEVLALLASLNEKAQKEDLHHYRNDIETLLKLIEENIAYENHFLLPILDEKMDELELEFFKMASLEYGFCLIRYQ